MPTAPGTAAEGALSLEARLWAQVEKTTHCWLWKGAKRLGYGRLGIDAHQLAYLLTRGQIPEGKVVMHTCDNPACVNPEHLQLGSRKDNFEDARRKGRWKYRVFAGTHNGMSKLSETQVREIKRRYKPRPQRPGRKAPGFVDMNTGLFITAEDIGRRFGLSKRPILGVLNGKSYREVA